ncbi:RDD family protein [Mycobacterium gallinarum]|uniref:RDD family protein n=1 Tax=Mycobacterium gallinarum TaxID=39689 RepID=A0A9W4B9D7_9MYCO|nr:MULTISPECIES: RDD family protein [Mycobacterium]MDV3136526.1 RDD family protein [Mycobacterium sp. 29Ha]BBY92418.1 RDD family protein [Mycobacterium gallinarum]
MTRPLGSWLSGSDPSGESGANEYPGQRLGLPPSGPGSIAGFGRRIAALLIDWFIAYGLVGLLVAVGLMNQQTFLYTPLGSTSIAVVWVVLGIISVRLFGFTPGQLALGVRVASIDNRIHVGLGRATVRGILVFFVIPALFTDSDLRGYQDRFTGTAVVKR